MSTKPIYQYTWVNEFRFERAEVKIVYGLPLPTHDQLKEDIRNGLRKATVQALTAKFAEIGRWIKVDSVTTNIDTFAAYGMPPDGPFCDASGTTTTVFETDMTPEEHESPGIVAILELIVLAVVAAILAHPLAFFALLILFALILFQREGGLKGVLFGPGAGGLGDIGTIIFIGILGIGGLLLLSSYLEKGKGKRRR